MIIRKILGGSTVPPASPQLGDGKSTSEAKSVPRGAEEDHEPEASSTWKSQGEIPPWGGISPGESFSL